MFYFEHRMKFDFLGGIGGIHTISDGHGPARPSPAQTKLMDLRPEPTTFGLGPAQALPPAKPDHVISLPSQSL